MDWSAVFVADITMSCLAVGRGLQHFSPTAVGRQVRRTARMLRPATSPMRFAGQEQPEQLASRAAAC